ncbi:MAG: aldo/keto reductase [Edaphobacter sp.]|uniref:aldo/keto reductase n=1 Tax=Edaphobacter sp. TaxID=1934404 RepID=UPI0023A3F637|nr:aldo/keto reductase [Edaphobacter sp.]MDE1178214.1 aldo/keto reductase [Edaphobacter sp.]
MNQRPLGRSDLSVSRIGLGCVTFGREIDEKTSFEIMDYATSQGINLFDTAGSYGGGESERIIGRWLRDRGCRDRIVLQSKLKPRYTREHIRASLEESLARLAVDHIDVYMLHEFDSLTPLEETMHALTLSIRSGKIGVAGCSNFTIEQMQTARTIENHNAPFRFEVVQPMYNLVARQIEADLLPYCRENRIGVTSYSPLGAGFLTGKYSRDTNMVSRGSRFDVVPGHRDIYFTPTNFSILEGLKLLSAQVGIPTSRLALGWVLRNEDVDSVLVGGTSVAHIQNALEALQSELDPKLITKLDELSARID